MDRRLIAYTAEQSAGEESKLGPGKPLEMLCARAGRLACRVAMLVWEHAVVIELWGQYRADLTHGEKIIIMK